MLKKKMVDRYINRRDNIKLKFMLNQGKLFKNIKNKLKKDESNLVNLEKKSLLKSLLKIVLKVIIKIFTYIKKVMQGEEYFYVRLIIFISILIITYDVSYIRRYIISIIIICWIIVYKKLYLLFKTEKSNRSKYLQFLRTHNKLNFLVIVPLYLILNRYVWLRRIQRIWIFINKILRYISLKLRIENYYKYIDEIMYYIMMVYLKVIVDQSYIMTEKIKDKIKKKNFKKIIDWRVLVLIINIILIQKLLMILGINIGQIIIIGLIIINIYLLDQMLIYLFNYNKFLIPILYFLKDRQYAKITLKDIYILPQVKLSRLSYTYIFYYYFSDELRLFPERNHKNRLNPNWYIYEYLCWGFFGASAEGRDYFNKYWLNEELYYADIIFGINIADINEYFVHLNAILREKSKFDYWIEFLENWNSGGNVFDYGYRCNINMKSVRKKVKKNLEPRMDINDVKIRRKIVPQNKLEKKFNSLNFKYWNIKELQEINDKRYQKCIEFLDILNEIFKENGQEIIINTHVCIKRDATLYRKEWTDDPNQIIYSEIIYNNYEIDNSKYKLKLHWKHFELKTRLKQKLEEMKQINTEWVNYIQTKKIPLIDLKSFALLQKPGKNLLKIPIFLLDTDDESDRLYCLINLEKYETYYMVERVKEIKELVKNHEKIRSNEEVKKYKINSDGSFVEIITEKEYQDQKEIVKELKKNLSEVSKRIKKNKMF